MLKTEAPSRLESTGQGVLLECLVVENLSLVVENLKLLECKRSAQRYRPKKRACVNGRKPFRRLRIDGGDVKKYLPITVPKGSKRKPERLRSFASFDE
jgi:hypothetical protein